MHSDKTESASVPGSWPPSSSRISSSTDFVCSRIVSVETPNVSATSFSV
jgi:hypothetical protein